jgi:hypothetical protein
MPAAGYWFQLKVVVDEFGARVELFRSGASPVWHSFHFSLRGIFSLTHFCQTNFCQTAIKDKIAARLP